MHDEKKSVVICTSIVGMHSESVKVRTRCFVFRSDIYIYGKQRALNTIAPVCGNIQPLRMRIIMMMMRNGERERAKKKLLKLKNCHCRGPHWMTQKWCCSSQLEKLAQPNTQSSSNNNNGMWNGKSAPQQIFINGHFSNSHLLWILLHPFRNDDDTLGICHLHHCFRLGKSRSCWPPQSSSWLPFATYACMHSRYTLAPRTTSYGAHILRYANVHSPETIVHHWLLLRERGAHTAVRQPKPNH